ncbi:MAG: amidohydrolase family protein [Ilumatobacteraceae bacterium]
MAHDLVIRNGTVYDGSGGAPVVTDVGIIGDTITTVGHITEPGAREIDATGMAVTPGFVDIHSHLDAQIGWDPLLTPSSNHGVTTALLGNCGVTFAPCEPTGRELLAHMMESVEDIPAKAILDGLPWTWESYGEYLDAIDRTRPGDQRDGARRSLRRPPVRDGRARHRGRSDRGRHRRHRRSGGAGRQRGRRWVLDVAHPVALHARRPVRAWHPGAARRDGRRRQGARPERADPERAELRWRLRRRDRPDPAGRRGRWPCSSAPA